MTARPLEYDSSLVGITSLKKVVDSVSMSTMCHVKNGFPSSQKLLCKLRCGRKLYSTVVSVVLKRQFSTALE